MTLRTWLAAKLLQIDPTWFAHLTNDDRTSPRTLARRIDELAEDLDYINQQLARLRGRQVGGIRRKKLLEEEQELIVVGEGDPDPDPDLFEEVTDQFTRKVIHIDDGRKNNNGSESANNPEV